VTDPRLLALIKAKVESLHDLDDEDIDLLIRLTEEAQAEVDRLRRYRSLGQIPRLDLLLDERDQARAEVEQLRAEVAEWKQAVGAEADLADERGRTIRRLRGLLGRLEWADKHIDWAARAYDFNLASSESCCPACHAIAAREKRHEPGCWLAAELAPNANDPPEGSQP
jgi:hypothetical protein